jgi:hypothetical protein
MQTEKYLNDTPYMLYTFILTLCPQIPQLGSPTIRKPEFINASPAQSIEDNTPHTSRESFNILREWISS